MVLRYRGPFAAYDSQGNRYVIVSEALHGTAEGQQVHIGNNLRTKGGIISVTRLEPGVYRVELTPPVRVFTDGSEADP